MWHTQCYHIMKIMILISIRPFAPKKLFALVATIACLSTASCFADAMYLSAKVGSSQRDLSRGQQSEQSSASVARPPSFFSVPGDFVQDLRGAV